jgi:hypothetical protein
MDEQHERTAGYVVPSYRARDGAAWYHFLHGNVPGHQIDFIYRPEVPQGPLTRQHFSHLARLMKYIEPQSNERFAFAIGNLSRDDTQYEPGHGGVAIIFGLRIRGATDHAGRQDPPFAHGIAAVDRALDYPTLIASAVAFYRHVLGAAESAEWYRAYVSGALEDPGAVRGVLEGYVERFGDLPEPPESTMAPAWETGGATQPRRIVVAHEDDVDFGAVAIAAARIAAVLYRSDIRWTVISNGREDDVPNGVSIRLLARTELSGADAAATVYDLADLPEDEVGLAAQLFGATPVGIPEKRTRGWRERYSEMDAPPARARARDPGSGDEISVDLNVDAGRASSHPGGRHSAPAPMGEPAAPFPAPIKPAPSVVAAPPSTRPPAEGDLREGDRAALLEMPIPASPPAPVQAESAGPPAMAKATLAVPVTPLGLPPPPVGTAAPHVPARVIAPPRQPSPAPSKGKRWLVGLGLCVVVGALIVLLVRNGGTEPTPDDAPSKSNNAPPPLPPTAAPTRPPPSSATTPTPPASAPAPPPRDSSAAPSASAAPSPRRGPRVPRTTSTVFDGRWVQ